MILKGILKGCYHQLPLADFDPLSSHDLALAPMALPTAKDSKGIDSTSAMDPNERSFTVLSEAELRKVFDEMDIDRSGTLELKEIEEGLKRLGIPNVNKTTKVFKNPSNTLQIAFLCPD